MGLKRTVPRVQRLPAPLTAGRRKGSALVRAQVQPRIRNRKMSTGTGTPISHSSSQPTLPRCFSTCDFTFFSSKTAHLGYWGTADHPLYPGRAGEDALFLRTRGTARRLD